MMKSNAGILSEIAKNPYPLSLLTQIDVLAIRESSEHFSRKMHCQRANCQDGLHTQVREISYFLRQRKPQDWWEKLEYTSRVVGL